MADTAWEDEFLVPGYEGEEHLKAGEFVYSLAMALRPLSETQQTILLQCMRPLFEGGSDSNIHRNSRVLRNS